MIAGVFFPSHPSIDSRIQQLRGKLRREQKMVQAHAFVRLPPLEFVVPEGPERSRRMQLPESVRPALAKQPRECFTTGWLHQSVVIQRASWGRYPAAWAPRCNRPLEPPAPQL